MSELKIRLEQHIHELYEKTANGDLEATKELHQLMFMANHKLEQSMSEVTMLQALRNGWVKLV